MSTRLLRRKILEVARAEVMAGGVAMKLSSARDPLNNKPLRQGWERCLKYFRLSAPDPMNPHRTCFSEDAIKYLSKPNELAPMPNWCGIFALYTLRAAAMKVGTCTAGTDISSVPGIRAIDVRSLTPGDIGVVANGCNRYVIVEDVFAEAGVPKVRTIEGNTNPHSSIDFVIRDLESITAGYSCL